MAGGTKRAASGTTPGAKRARVGNSKLKFKSPAEFFAENKNIAGFDNAGKSLYTTIRELVENGLDAAESVGILPDISIEVERLDADKFRAMVGMEGGERVDATLYKDVETEREKKAREAKEKRDKKKKEGENVEEKKERRGGDEMFRVTVTDNGCGMAFGDVPDMMGRVLAGTKYCVRQTRGKFGLGSKMALIWAKMSSGVPVEVETARKGEDVTHCVLDIDIAKNVPHILKHVKKENKTKWTGTKVSVTSQGNWTTYRAKILLYVRQMAVITPYAQFRLVYSCGLPDDSRDLELLFARRTDIMPKPAQEVKHHPSSVNQLLLKQLINEVEPSMSLIRFLTTQFVCISRALATRLITELGSDFTMHMPISTLSLNHIRQLDSLLRQARFDKPDGSCLSPAGEYNLRLGITKELQPSMVATHAEPAEVFEGHAFVVEAGVALGGSGMKPGLNVFRFANRIPLLFEAGNDVVTKTARENIRWANYKISPTSERIGVICSIVSTKIPFKGTGKEYIADDSESIKRCVKRAITQCCLQLRTKLVRQALQRDAAQRKMAITKYIPDVTNALMTLFEDLPPTAEIADVIHNIRQGSITKPILHTKLTTHVQQIDKEQALELASITGKTPSNTTPLYLSPRSIPPAYTAITPPQTALRLSLLSTLQSTL